MTNNVYTYSEHSGVSRGSQESSVVELANEATENQGNSRTGPSREELFEGCSHIAKCPNVLGLFEEELHRCGLAGERRYAKLLFLILHTRFFEQPVSAVIKGPSAGGKSFLLKTVLRFVPKAAFEAVTGLSDKALVYWDKDLRNRFLVVYEAAGLQRGTGRTLLRTLLSEGHINYATLGPTKDGWKSHELYREGPTGLLMTTTATGLHPEDESRLLSINVDDTRDQIQRVLELMAAKLTGDVELNGWHAFHAWVALGKHDVCIPFATHLARLTKPAHNKVKRDFGHVLNLIRSHALIHQHNRPRDENDFVVATLEDYAVVRDLIADIVSSGVAASVTPEIRETVEVIERLTSSGSNHEVADTTFEDNEGVSTTGVSLTSVANALQIDKSAASRRVSQAEELGYIRDFETRQGRPSKLVCGDALSSDLDVLPSIAELKTHLDSCSTRD